MPREGSGGSGEEQGSPQYTEPLARWGGSGPGATFTVRRVSHEIGVERTFLIHSPTVEAVDVVRMGAVRRARLQYLRGRSGKQARIKERRAE